jgi:hypothetical protein
MFDAPESPCRGRLPVYDVKVRSLTDGKRAIAPQVRRRCPRGSGQRGDRAIAWRLEDSGGLRIFLRDREKTGEQYRDAGGDPGATNDRAHYV